MTINDRRDLKNAAQASLNRDPQAAGRLVLLHTGASLALTLAATLLDYVLQQRIGATGGLSGMGMRSMLSTLQSILRYGQMLVLPFWELGYLYITLRIARGEPAAPGHLLEGFRRFGPILRLKLLLGLIYTGLGIVAGYISSAVLMFTPWGMTLSETLLPYFTENAVLDENLVLDEAAANAIADAMLPIMLIFLGVFLLLSLPVLYRYRMADLYLLDHPGEGAISAARNSRRMMRGNCIRLLKLDISFWWYYLLSTLVTLVCLGDAGLALLGVTPPWGEATGMLIFTVLYAALLLLLHWRCRNQVEVTYAHAYGVLCAGDTGPQFSRPVDVPWDLPQ